VLLRAVVPSESMRTRGSSPWISLSVGPSRCGRQRVVGERVSGVLPLVIMLLRDRRSSQLGTTLVTRSSASAVRGRLLGCEARSRASEVRGVPVPPVVLRSRVTRTAVVLAVFVEQLGQGRDIHDAQRPEAGLVISCRSQVLPSGAEKAWRTEP